MRIAVFDSGIGGMTVLRELRARFPREEFLYFGDTANVPYGTKSVTQVEGLCHSAASRIRERNPAVVIIACNTASSLALKLMKEALHPVPVLGVVEAGVAAVLQGVQTSSQSGPVLILGTRATVKSQIYGRLLRQAGVGREVLEQECPLLVPMIEEGWVDHPILHQTIQEYVMKYQARPAGLALLACTHYPWIRTAFERALPGWKVLDSATAVADQLGRTFALPEGVSVRDEGSDASVSDPSRIQWYFSDPDSVSRALLISESGSGAVEAF